MLIISPFFAQLEWPQEPEWDTPLRVSFRELVDGEIADVTVEMNGSNHDDLLSGLDAPVCEVVRPQPLAHLAPHRFVQGPCVLLAAE